MFGPPILLGVDPPIFVWKYRVGVFDHPYLLFFQPIMWGGWVFDPPPYRFFKKCRVGIPPTFFLVSTPPLYFNSSFYHVFIYTISVYQLFLGSLKLPLYQCGSGMRLRCAAPRQHRIRIESHLYIFDDYTCVCVMQCDFFRMFQGILQECSTYDQFKMQRIVSRNRIR